MVENLGLISL